MHSEAAYRRLRNSPHHDLVVAANRAYLAAAVPDAPRGAGSRWVLTCLPATGAPGGGRRLSAVNMRWMETFVLYVPAGTDNLHGLVNMRRVALEQEYGSLRCAGDRVGLAFVAASYRDPGPDQIQARGTATQLLAALGHEPFAGAARALAVSLQAYRTPYARFHNPHLTAAVLGSR